jgi:hypothetical protein
LVAGCLGGGCPAEGAAVDGLIERECEEERAWG